MTREKPKILLVDDDTGLLELISMRLTAAGYAVQTATSGEAALASLAIARPRLVIADLRMDGMDGLALFEAIHRESPSLPVVIMTAHGTIPDAVSAVKLGVFGFLTKPFDGHVLLETVDEALRATGGRRAPADAWRAGIETRSPIMENVLLQTQRVAASDANVCIFGASGTGKELLARALHAASPRAEAPFVAVNCGAIPEGLLESELFGHRKGAFTGASQDREGLFQAAEGGTLFLDEVGDMPLALQVKLLRALEDRAVRPVGADAPVAVNARIVSATHRSLETHIAAGAFREDLFYRLNVVRLTLPSLAERREDVPLLARHFLARLAERYERPKLAFSPEAVELMVSAAWPGNVRQLLNVVEQAVALTATDMLPAALVRQALGMPATSLTPLDEARKAFERDYLVRILKITDGNVTRAARLAGRNRTEFYRLLERHALAPSMFKAAALH
ncbi:MAG TPA: sigma 54-interacting transcriptional regulator [Burkholderiales bacterium]